MKIDSSPKIPSNSLETNPCINKPPSVSICNSNIKHLTSNESAKLTLKSAHTKPYGDNNETSEYLFSKNLLVELETKSGKKNDDEYYFMPVPDPEPQPAPGG